MLILYILALPSFTICRIEECLNKEDGLKSSWEEFLLTNTPPRLHYVDLFETPKKELFPFTVVTHLSLDRLSALETLCKSFSGPIVAAAYFPIFHHNRDNLKGIASHHVHTIVQNSRKVSESTARSGNRGVCQLSTILIYEIFDSKKGKLLYPGNSLRNYARLLVKTKLFAMIDVDFQLSSTLCKQVSSQIQELELLASLKHAFIIPAFESVAGAISLDNPLTVSKDVLHSIFKSQGVRQFKLSNYPLGHNRTNYEFWFSTNLRYEVQWCRGYEPYVILHNDVAPWYDVNFSHTCLCASMPCLHSSSVCVVSSVDGGFGLNKVVYIADLYHQGFQMEVLADGWMVHLPHEDTPLGKLYKSDDKSIRDKYSLDYSDRILFKKKMITLFDQALMSMEDGLYKTKVDCGFLCSLDFDTHEVSMHSLTAHTVPLYNVDADCEQNMGKVFWHGIDISFMIFPPLLLAFFIILFKATRKSPPQASMYGFLKQIADRREDE